MTKEVFFYFDIFNNNGLGHYSRCSVLNYQLNKRKIKTFLLILKKKKIRKFKEFNIFQIKNLNKKKDILIIDDYLISSDKIMILKKYFKYVFLIEDVPSNRKNVDVIINPNYQIKKKDYNQENIIKFFLGPRYKMIKEFKIAKKKKESFLISFGGGIVFNRIKHILKYILVYTMNLSYKKKINIFLNLNKAQFNYFKKFKNLDLNIKKPGLTYPSLLSSSVFCISSLGVQHDEILKKKIPAIFLKIDNNQNNNFKISKKLNSDFTFDVNNFDKKKLFNALIKINQEKYRNQIVKNYSNIKLGNKVFEIIEFIKKKLYE